MLFRHLTWGAGLDWEVRGSRFRAAPDYAADLRHARRQRPSPAPCLVSPC